MMIIDPTTRLTSPQLLMTIDISIPGIDISYEVCCLSTSTGTISTYDTRKARRLLDSVKTSCSGKSRLRKSGNRKHSNWMKIESIHRVLLENILTIRKI